MIGQELTDKTRLSDLRETGLLDVRDDPSFNRFVRLASRMLQVPMSAVTLVSDSCQHFVGEVGLPLGEEANSETPLSESICKFVVRTGRPLAIEDTRKDDRFESILAVLHGDIGSYLGVPIVTSTGNVLGSFCVMQPEPRRWEDDELAFMEDLRAAVCSEVELRRQTRRLESMLSELEQSYARNDEMIHMIIHDLRNPLSGIMGGVQLLRSTEDRPTEDEELISIVEESCEQMEDLIGEILETNKFRTGRFKVQASSVDLGALLDELQDQLELMGRSKSIQGHFELEERLGDCFADRRLLKRALQNLLNNAVKFTPKDGDIYFSVGTADDGGTVVFSVSDTGSGVPDDEKESIFGKFAVGKISSPRSIGLGLAFCRLVAEAHGGKVFVKDGPNEIGSVFVLAIPREGSE